MNNLIFSANAVLPLFLFMLLGMLLRRIGILDHAFAESGTRLCFNVLLPIMIFNSVISRDPAQSFDWKLLYFLMAGCFLLLGLLLLVVPRCIVDNKRRSVVIQALLRSNYTLFAVPACTAMYGAEGAAAASMMIIFVVPFFNIASVYIFNRYDPDSAHSIKATLQKIALNPLILGCLLGFAFNLTGLTLPDFLSSTVQGLASAATPLMVMLLGADIALDGFRENIRPLTAVIFFRLILIPAVFTFLGWKLGFTGPAFAIILMVFASPTAVVSYTVARAAHADYALAGQVVMASSLLSVFSIFLWILLYRSIGVLV